MKRLLTCTAVGLFIGLTPALAQTERPMDESQTPPAMQEPAQPSENLQPSDPGDPIRDDGSDMAPRAAQPEPATPPSTLSTEAPSMAPADRPSMALTESPQFLTRQESGDLLASDVIGLSVMNAKNESIGTVSDLITDANGKVMAILFRTGDFLGIGGKDVALRYEDVKFSRDEDNDITVMTNLGEETLASAPDYETLDEQNVTVGSTSDRENSGQ